VWFFFVNMVNMPRRSRGRPSRASRRSLGARRNGKVSPKRRRRSSRRYRSSSNTVRYTTDEEFQKDDSGNEFITVMETEPSEPHVQIFLRENVEGNTVFPSQIEISKVINRGDNYYVGDVHWRVAEHKIDEHLQTEEIQTLNELKQYIPDDFHILITPEDVSAYLNAIAEILRRQQTYSRDANTSPFVSCLERVPCLGEALDQRWEDIHTELRRSSDRIMTNALEPIFKRIRAEIREKRRRRLRRRRTDEDR